MKCLIVCNYFQPKIPYAESQIALALQKQGHQVQVISGDRFFPFPSYQETVEKILGPRQQKAGTTIEAGLKVERQQIFFEFFARSFYGGIGKKIRAWSPDVVISFGLSTPSTIQVALTKVCAPKSKKFTFIGVDSHLPSEFNSGNILLKNVIYFIFRFFFSSLLNAQLDKAVAVQEGTLEIIHKYYGVTKNVQLVSHGTDTDLFTFNPKDREKIRKRLSIQPGDFVCIYTGKIIPAKGVDILLKAFALLVKKYPKVKLLLVGAGPQSYLDQIFSSLSPECKSKIIITGFQDHTELVKYYSASDLAIWPLQESLAMIDAACCSLPFIANHTLGAKERVANNNALLYNQNDATDLFKKIEQLYLDPKLRKAMGQRGHELVVSSFSWQKVAQRYLQIL